LKKTIACIASCTVGFDVSSRPLIFVDSQLYQNGSVAVLLVSTNFNCRSSCRRGHLLLRMQLEQHIWWKTTVCNSSNDKWYVLKKLQWIWTKRRPCIRTLPCRSTGCWRRCSHCEILCNMARQGEAEPLCWPHRHTQDQSSILRMRRRQMQWVIRNLWITVALICNPS
jgi:hypothetical protein